MRRFDVIVVGAGPAGCAAAYDLAQTGIGVLLLDRRSFPRIKPCAGMLTVKAVNRLRYSIAPVIRFVARDLEVSLDRQRSWVLPSASPIAVMTVRREFDAFCLERTLEEGASFEVVEDLTDIVEDTDGVTLTTNKETFRCGYLVGADGANSQVRRLLRYGQSAHALALEGTLINTGVPAVTRFDFRCVDGGYGWVFPKRDHFNVGLYTQRAGLTLSKGDLRNYAKLAAGSDRVEDIIGYPIGIGGEHHRAVRHRIFLVGDALGATERLLGEGIHNAIKTGQAAAAAISGAILEGKEALRRFNRSVREVQRDLQACSGAARWFYNMPTPQFGKLATHGRWTHLMRGFAAGMTFRDISRTFFLSRFYRIRPVPAVIEYEDARRLKPDLLCEGLDFHA
jgi:geranylgeranyl reductase family protein